MILSYWTLLVALSLSLIAAWYSIAGLAAIFAAAVVPIVIMGSVMEVAKITVTIWLHEYWQYCKRSMKIQLTASVVLLMVITSLGIFGFLSKAHLDQAVPTGDVAARVGLIDEKIRTERDTIDAARRALAQMDATVDQTISRSTTEQGADKAVTLRRSQARERTTLQTEIAASQKKIAALNEERAPIASELRKVEAEVGPIKYIAALIYGDNPDANLLEKSVRWVIIVLVIVFDPLAIMMVLAATESLKWEKQKQGRRPDDSVELVENLDTDAENTTDPKQKFINSDWLTANAFWPFAKAEVTTNPPGYEPDDEPLTDNQPAQIKESAKNQIDDAEETPEIKEAMRIWKEQNPDDTLKHQRHLLDQGKIATLPWMSLIADNAKPRETKSGFGTRFPDMPDRGDVFVRVDQLPTTLYKFNGTNWIQIDKGSTDNYTYDTAYITHLIDKLASGELDIDLLSDGEREQITQQLQLRQPNDQ
jgi:hypothetical protein